MSPAYMLRKSLCRKAHCFRAHVPGHGYVNDGAREDWRADYDRQRYQRAIAEIDNLQWADGYAEPGHTAPVRGVLFADWNVFPPEIDRILERAGYEVEWADEWTTCDGCQKALRIAPDSFVWTPAYVTQDNGAIFCHTCAEDETEDEVAS